MNETQPPAGKRSGQSSTEPHTGIPWNGRVQRWLLGVIAAGVVLVVLVQGRFFLIPLAIAILLFSLTSAVIDFFARMRIGRLALPNWVGSVVAVLVIASALLALFGVVTAQIDGVMTTAPAYADRIQEAVAALFVWLGDDVAQSVLLAFQDINVGAYIRAFAGQAGNLLAVLVLIVLYIGFLFAERPWFSTKIAMLFPEPRQAAHVEQIFTSISRSIHHYILVKTGVSAATAIIVYFMLTIYGLDFAETLAVMVFVLNFIPNIGSIVATALPTLIALVQFDGWTMVLVVLTTVGSIQFLIGNVIDPMLMGRTLHLSSFAIILSLTFWGAIWGIVGMFLAVPIMVIVMIVCSHVPGLHPIAIMLSRDGRAALVEPESGEDG
jgi:AI-2 transport protein TqsA